MLYTATARPIDGTLRHEVDVNGRHTLITDEPEHLGGTDAAPTPHELVAAAIASCVSTMIMLYARNHDWELGEGLRVDADYAADTTPRRVTVMLHLPDGLSPEQIKRLQRVAHTCPVRRALEAGFAFEESVSVDASAALATPALASRSTRYGARV